MRSIWTDEEVKPDEALWRYFRTDRLVAALQSGFLHFPSARQFEDPFEGVNKVGAAPGAVTAVVKLKTADQGPTPPAFSARTRQK